MCTQIHNNSQSTSAGAHNTQRPLPLPVAHRSTTLGCEHVTACVAVILAHPIGSLIRQGCQREAWNIPLGVRQLGDELSLDACSAMGALIKKKDILCRNKCGGSDPYSRPGVCDACRCDGSTESIRGSVTYRKMGVDVWIGSPYGAQRGQPSSLHDTVSHRSLTPETSACLQLTV